MKRAFGSLGLVALTQTRTFFGKGWDNASLEIAYRSLLKKPEVADRLKDEFVQFMDTRTLEQFRLVGDACEAKKVPLKVYLPPHIGDAHRLLKMYSLTAYPILDEKGEQMTAGVEGEHLPCFADPDDDYAKVCVPQLKLVEFLAQDLLKTLGWEPTPRGAASFLEALYRGAEIPDHVYETPRVIERL